MCKPKKKVMLMYFIIHERLKQCRDPFGMINHKNIQLILCRLFHTPKEYTNRIINELQQLYIIEPMGRNQLGSFYKVR